MKTSIVIPVFNDAQALSELARRLFSAMDMAGLGVELVVIDDGSENDVWSEMEGLKVAFPERQIVLFRLETNEGQHRATLFGIMHCSHDVIITMDSDLQHPPEEVPRLVEALTAGGYDLVYGTAWAGHPCMRRWAGFLFSKVANISVKEPVRGSSFRALTRKSADKLISGAGTSFVFIDAILREMDLSMVTVEVEHHPRRHGKSSYSVWASLLMTLRGFWFYLLPRVTRKGSGLREGQ